MRRLLGQGGPGGCSEGHPACFASLPGPERFLAFNPGMQRLYQIMENKEDGGGRKSRTFQECCKSLDPSNSARSGRETGRGPKPSELGVLRAGLRGDPWPQSRKGSPGTMGLVPAWPRSCSGSPGPGQGTGGGGGQFLPSTFAHNLFLQRAVPAALNPRGFLTGFGDVLRGEGEVSPLGLEPGAGCRAVMWMLLPAPTLCFPHQDPTSLQPPHPRAGGVSWGPARSITVLVTAPSL